MLKKAWSAWSQIHLLTYFYFWLRVQHYVFFVFYFQVGKISKDIDAAETWLPIKLLSPYHQKIRPCNNHVIPWTSFYSFIADELQVFFSIIEKLKWQKIRFSNVILIKLLYPYHHKIRSCNDHVIRWTSFYFFYCRWTPSDFFYYWKAWNGK